MFLEKSVKDNNLPGEGYLIQREEKLIQLHSFCKLLPDVVLCCKITVCMLHLREMLSCWQKMYLLEQLQSAIGNDNLFICVIERPGHTEVADKKECTPGEVTGWGVYKRYSALLVDAGRVCK